MELKDILNKKINSLGIGKQVTAAQVCASYDKAILEIFGEEGKKNTEAISYKNGVLKVRVSSSVWSQELQGKSEEIKKLINNKDLKKIIYSL